MKTLAMPFAVIAFWLAGCGSDGGGGAGPVETSRKLSDLTLDEKATLCAQNSAAFAAIVSGSCTLSGLDAPTKADCEMARDQCKADPASSGSVCTNNGVPPDFTACTTVTVDQATACLSSAMTYFDGLSCDAAGQALPTAPGCVGTVELGCPVLFDGTGSN